MTCVWPACAAAWRGVALSLSSRLTGAPPSFKRTLTSQISKCRVLNVRRPMVWTRDILENWSGLVSNPWLWNFILHSVFLIVTSTIRCQWQIDSYLRHHLLKISIFMWYFKLSVVRTILVYMNRCMSGRMDEWMDGWMNGWMDIDECMDRWMRGW